MTEVMVADHSVGNVRQRLHKVLVAEIAALLRQGGVRVGLWFSLLAGIAVGSITALFLAVLSSEGAERVSSTVALVPIEAGAVTFAIIFTLSSVMYFGRAAENGLILSSMQLVPNRARLYGAKILSVAALAAVATAVVGSVVAVFSLSSSGYLEWLDEALVGILSASVAAALAAVLVFCIAILANRSTTAILIYIGWWIVSPLVLQVIGTALPSWLASITDVIIETTPTNLLASAMAISDYSKQGPSELIEGVGGLLIWAVVLGITTARVFSRRSV